MLSVRCCTFKQMPAGQCDRALCKREGAMHDGMPQVTDRRRHREECGAHVGPLVARGARLAAGPPRDEADGLVEAVANGVVVVPAVRGLEFGHKAAGVRAACDSALVASWAACTSTSAVQMRRARHCNQVHPTQRTSGYVWVRSGTMASLVTCSHTATRRTSGFAKPAHGNGRWPSCMPCMPASGSNARGIAHGSGATIGRICSGCGRARRDAVVPRLSGRAAPAAQTSTPPMPAPCVATPPC